MTTSAKPKATPTAAAQKPATTKTTTTGATAKKVAGKTASKVATTKTQTVAKKAKLPKVKMVRDSYSMPEADYAKLIELKKKCISAGVKVKKSELLRAGLLSLHKLSDSALLKEIGKVVPSAEK